MAESTETKKNGWGCKCCDENDPKCQCFHHKFTGHMALKKILVLIILGIVFAMGIGVGKLSTYRELGLGREGGYGFMHNRGYNNDSWRMMPSYNSYGKNGYNGVPPMMNPAYWQNTQQNATSTPKVK